MADKLSEKGISPTPDGYLVRIYRKGQTISGFVSYNDYPDMQAALQAARTMREEMKKAYPAQPRPVRQSVGMGD